MATPHQGRTLPYRQSPATWTNEKVGFLTRAGGEGVAVLAVPVDCVQPAASVGITPEPEGV
ncbi:MAG TPA: hypothetical protein VE956_14520 [Nodularia sp. (in: cyanobacteria)]|nr:hypothetical protein [Nodularia sp. (in: cyanobacteria)]